MSRAGSRSDRVLRPERAVNSAMSIYWNRDVDVLRDHKGGSGIGFEQVRDFGTCHQDTRLPEDRRDGAKRSQKTCPEVHPCLEVYVPCMRGATR
jgi:hypothetical protein